MGRLRAPRGPSRGPSYECHAWIHNMCVWAGRGGHARSILEAVASKTERRPLSLPAAGGNVVFRRLRSELRTRPESEKWSCARVTPGNGKPSSCGATEGYEGKKSKNGRVGHFLSMALGTRTGIERVRPIHFACLPGERPPVVTVRRCATRHRPGRRALETIAPRSDVRPSPRPSFMHASDPTLRSTTDARCDHLATRMMSTTAATTGANARTRVGAPPLPRRRPPARVTSSSCLTCPRSDILGMAPLLPPPATTTPHFSSSASLRSARLALFNYLLVASTR